MQLYPEIVPFDTGLLKVDEIHSLYYFTRHFVRHLALASIGPQESPVDVGLSEHRGDPLAPHVGPCVAPGGVPACPDGSTGRRTHVLPFSCLSPGYETSTSNFRGLVLV